MRFLKNPPARMNIQSPPGALERFAPSRSGLRCWLTEQSLRQFFEVVDRVAPESLWPYRRAFWNALYRRDYVSDAWVV
jgi:hypothetical protein